MRVPKEIHIRSDENTLSFVETIKQKDGLIHRYKYTKSLSKLGYILDLTDGQLQKIIYTNQ